MAIDGIRKIFVVGHREIEADLIGSLQDLGVVEVSLFPGGSPAPATVEEQPDLHELDRKLERLDRTIGILAKNAAKKGFLSGGAQRVALSPAELKRLVAEDDSEEIASRCQSLEKELQEHRAAKAGIEAQKKQLVPWLTLDVPLERLTSSGMVGVAVGQIPLNRDDDLRTALASLGETHALHEVNADSRSRYFVLFHDASDAAAVADILKDREFTPLAHPGAAGTPHDIMSRLDLELERLHREERQVREDLAALFPRRAHLLVLHDHYANLRARLRVADWLARTDSSVCLTGWVPTRETLRVKRELEERIPLLEVLFAEPDPEDQVPVILKNGPVVRPFEVVTDLYGRPVYGGVDPTPYLSIFFAAFFGFCLTDAGYGLVLMLITGILLWLWKKDQGPARKKFYQLFFLGGVATVLLGAMVGTWFGITVEWKLFDALEDLMTFFALALALGVLHIFTGLSIKMARTIRSGDLAGGLYDQGLWMLIILSLIGLGLVKAGLLPVGLYPLTQVLSLGAALGIVFFQGRQADGTAGRLKSWTGSLYQGLWAFLAVSLAFFLLRFLRPGTGYAALAALVAIVVFGARNLTGILARIGLGLFSLYGISGFLGDILSYSRLVALGLTTGIVGMIINKMAGIAVGTPVVGWLLALAILIAGHAFNIVINLLGAFVHSCRLQYVEFFTKFYEAGGRPFKPFQHENRYTIVND